MFGSYWALMFSNICGWLSGQPLSVCETTLPVAFQFYLSFSQILI